MAFLGWFRCFRFWGSLEGFIISFGSNFCRKCFWLAGRLKFDILDDFIKVDLVLLVLFTELLMFNSFRKFLVFGLVIFYRFTLILILETDVISPSTTNENLPRFLDFFRL